MSRPTPKIHFENLTDPYSQILLDNYVERKQRNPKYSIRAYSNYLGVDHSLLSKVLKGKTKFSTRVYVQCLEKLGMHEDTIKALIKASSSDSEWKNISEDEIEVISKWQHLAIIELLSIPGYIGTVLNTAQVLGLKIVDAQAMFDRLEHLGHIKRDEDIYSCLTTHNTSYPQSNETTEARRLNQKRLLKESINSLAETPFSKRDHSAVTMAIAEEDMPLYKEWIKDARRQLTKLFQKNTNFNSVYTLQISFFPVIKSTRINK